MSGVIPRWVSPGLFIKISEICEGNGRKGDEGGEFTRCFFFDIHFCLNF